MNSSHVASLASLLVLTPACADRASFSDIDEVPSEDVDARDYCPARQAGPLAELAETSGAVVAGPCGDLVYEVGDAQFWYRPGSGSVSVDAEAWTTKFAPSGHLLAWERRAEDGLLLADTRDGSIVELPDPHSFGLVPVPGSDHGADLWTCTDGVLELAGPVATASITDAVACESVRGSSGSPRVVYADQAGQLHVADLESLDVWDIDDLEYENGSLNSDGFQRDDWARIDHDGRVIVHQLAFWETSPDTDSDWRIVDGMRVFVDGEPAASWPALQAPYDMFQQAVRGAPVWLRPDGNLLALANGEQHQHGPLGRMVLDASGRAFAVDPLAQSLLRSSPDGATLELIADEVDVRDLWVSNSGEWAAIERMNPACADDTSACPSGFTSLQLWHEGQGLLPARVSDRQWEVAAIGDDGVLVTVGRDSLAISELLVFDGALEQLAAREVAYSTRPRTVNALADGRVLVELAVDGVGELLLVDPGATAASERITVVPDSFAIANSRVFVDASESNLAFVDTDADGRWRLVAGGMP